MFTRFSWDTYNLYYQEFRLFLITNKSSLVSVTEKQINRIFMANLSFPKPLLDINLYGFTSMADSVERIQEFLNLK